jgi:hypothetical protein
MRQHYNTVRSKEMALYAEVAGANEAELLEEAFLAEASKDMEEGEEVFTDEAVASSSVRMSRCFFCMDTLLTAKTIVVHVAGQVPTQKAKIL